MGILQFFHDVFGLTLGPKDQDPMNLSDIARTQIGTQEDAAHTNKGSAILKYQEATYEDGQGWPWCAAFVDWCVEQFLEEAPNPALKRPQTASAYGLLDWARANGCRVFTGNDRILQAQPGDIVVYTFSHCGIVSKAPDGGFFRAIEGNTNAGGGRDGYEVAERVRGLGCVMSFIRLP